MAASLPAAIASGDFTGSVIDAVNGTYTFNGSAVAIEDIIDCTKPAFDPDLDIDAGGIKLRDTAGREINFIGDLLTECLTNGYTIVLEFNPGEDATIGLYNYDSSDFDPISWITVFVDILAGTPNAQQLQSSDATTVDLTESALVSQTNKVAMTMTAARMAISLNGASVTAHEHPAVVTGMNFVGFTLGVTEATTAARIRSFAVYPPQLDADLPGLSA